MGIFKTADGGQTWTNYRRSFTYNSDVSFADTCLGYTVHSEGISETRDGGNTWVRQTKGIPHIPLEAIRIVDSKMAIVVGDSGTILKRNLPTASANKKSEERNIWKIRRNRLYGRLAVSSNVHVDMFDIRGRLTEELIGGMQSSGDFSKSLPEQSSPFFLDIEVDGARQQLDR